MTDGPQRPRPPTNRRRDKVQLSCDFCRHRKLKCDRQHPCGACSKRGLANLCKYASAPPTPDAQRPIGPLQSTSLNDRVTELESLVVTLIKGQSPQSSPVSTSSSASARLIADASAEFQRPKKSRDNNVTITDPGTLTLGESGTSYVQSVHWEAILAKIRGLKDDLVADGKTPTGSQLFYGPNRHATRDDILAAVPPRPVVDRLMALHFDSYIVTAYLIHSKKFLREYEAFWQDPSATSIAWIGLMFSMSYIAVQLQTFNIEFTDASVETPKAEYLTMRDAFLEKTVQCLVLAKYTAGGPYILETLITMLTGEFIILKDRATDGWLLISMILHLAMRMGYHRDPDNFPGISPFEGEMRRRIWTTILQLDLVLSLEMGLPRSAKDKHVDTKNPCNVHDSDFDEDTTTLRPRPETEWTPVLPLITRGRLIQALGLICDVNADVNPPSFDEILKIDGLLQDVHDHAIPPVLRWDTLRHPITDSPNIVVQRVSVETTFYKARILLYRTALVSYSTREHQERNRESVRICLDSALKILSFQQMLHEESQPLGRLCHLRWKVTHIFNQDVLLATSVLCLYLQDVDKFELSETAGKTTRYPKAEEIRKQLMTSHKIWLQMSTASAQAGKVAKALSIVLGSAEVFGESGSGSASFEFPVDFDVTSWNDSGVTSNNQYIHSGFYSPLTFFDNVLESWGT